MVITTIPAGIIRRAVGMWTDRVNGGRLSRNIYRGSKLDGLNSRISVAGAVLRGHGRAGRESQNQDAHYHNYAFLCHD